MSGYGGSLLDMARLGVACFVAAVLLLAVSVPVAPAAWATGSTVTVRATVAPVLRASRAGSGLVVVTNLRTARLDYGCSAGSGSRLLCPGETQCHGVTGFTLTAR